MLRMPRLQGGVRFPAATLLQERCILTNGIDSYRTPDKCGSVWLSVGLESAKSRPNPTDVGQADPCIDRRHAHLCRTCPCWPCKQRRDAWANAADPAIPSCTVSRTSLCVGCRRKGRFKPIQFGGEACKCIDWAAKLLTKCGPTPVEVGATSTAESAMSPRHGRANSRCRSLRCRRLRVGACSDL